MEAAQYDNFEYHKGLHRSLTLEIECLETRGIKDNDARPLLDFLKKWWIEHINDKDQLYARHLHINEAR
jgi:hemerythrin